MTASSLRHLVCMQDRSPPQASAHDTATAPGDLLNLHELVAKARQNLNQNDWDYIVGGVESETTLRRNRMALDAIAFRPRVLRDVSKVDASVSEFGRKLRLPVVLAPVGSLESFHAAGAESVVRAVDKFGAAHMLSSVSEPGLENVAKAAPDARDRLKARFVEVGADPEGGHRGGESRGLPARRPTCRPGRVVRWRVRSGAR